MPRHAVTHTTYAKLIKAIVDDPMPAHELADEIGVAKITAYRILRALKSQSVVHICEWERDRLGRAQVPVFKFGEGRNKQRPKMTAAERQKACRDRRKLRLMSSLTAGVPI